MTFLLGSTWLALHIVIAEHGALLAAAALAMAQPAAHRIGRTA